MLETEVRDRELVALRAQLAQYQRVQQTLHSAVLGRHDITINGVVYRPVN